MTEQALASCADAIPAWPKEERSHLIRLDAIAFALIAGASVAALLYMTQRATLAAGQGVVWDAHLHLVFPPSVNLSPIMGIVSTALASASVVALALHLRHPLAWMAGIIVPAGEITNLSFFLGEHRVPNFIIFTFGRMHLATNYADLAVVGGAALLILSLFLCHSERS